MKRLIMFLLLCPSLSFAQSAEVNAVSQSVEKLRKTLIDPDQSMLESLVSEKLTYGHSSGKIEDKASFIEALVSGESDFSSVTFEDQQISLSGNVAVVRHKLRGETVADGKASPVNIGVLLIWQKVDGTWKLLARQAFKL